MAFLTMTYTFANSTTADATQVNTNFQDVIDALSDGTLDLNVNVITAAGAVVLNGNVTFGSGSTKDVTFLGSLASNIPVKTNTTYGIGSATIGLSGVYFGGTSSFTTRVVGSATASYTITLPPTAGSTGLVLQNTGSGVLQWGHGETSVVAKTADYVILDTDGFLTITCNGSGTDVAITLPALANNLGRTIKIVQLGDVDTDGTGVINVTRAGSDVIGPATETVIKLISLNDNIALHASATRWEIMKLRQTEFAYNTALTDTNDTTSFAYGHQGGQFPNVTGGKTKRIGWLSASVQGVEITFQMSSDTTTTWTNLGHENAVVQAFTNSNTNNYGIYLTPVSSTAVGVFFGKYRLANSATFTAAGADWSDIDTDAQYKWRVRKLRLV